MRNLFALPMLVMLTACVSYYQPQYALEDNVYYPENDPSYIYNPDDVNRIVYYPWSSLDYFYFGYSPFPYTGYYYDYPYTFAYASWGYPPPFYTWYSPFYFSYYHTSYGRPHYGNCTPGDHCRRHNHDGRDHGDDRYTGDNRQYDRYTDEYGEEKVLYSNGRKNKMGGAGTPPTRRVVSPAPGHYPAGTRTIVRDGKPTKTRKSRTEPVYTGKRNTVTASPPVSETSRHMHQAAPAVTSSRRSSGSPSFNSSARSSSSPSHEKSASHRDRD